jgi:PIN domain nuclease of toxin-antitoxin system
MRSAVRDKLAERTTTLWVSAASAWEISIKTRIGRLDEPLLSAWPDSDSVALADQVMPMRFRLRGCRGESFRG